MALRRANGDALEDLGVINGFGSQEDAVKYLEGARQAYRSIDDLKLGDLPAAIAFSEASAWQTGALMAVGRNDDAIRVGQEAVAIATRVLQKHPGYTTALRARAIAGGNLAAAEANDYHVSKAFDYNESSIRDYQALVVIDPSNAIAWNNLAGAHDSEGQGLGVVGRIDDARKQYQMALDLEHQTALSSLLAFTLSSAAVHRVQLEADQGNLQQAKMARVNLARLVDRAVAGLPAASMPRMFIRTDSDLGAIAVPVAAGDFRAVRADAETVAQRLEALKTNGPGQDDEKRRLLIRAYDAQADAAYHLHDDAAAAKASARVGELHRELPPRTTWEARDESDEKMLAALIAVRLGNAAEARDIIEPVLKFHRDLYARNKEDRTQHVQMARALYVAASAGLGDRSQELREAAAILAGLPPQMVRSVSVGRLRDDIAVEQGRRK
ncbi:MAG: hypothetical protein ABI190_09230 [Casimicrobiaceae bacterium]